MDEAIGWLISLRRGNAAQWEAFTAWLEVDRAHSEAYDRLAAMDSELDGLSSANAALAAPRPDPAPERSRRWVIGTGAAALAAAGAWLLMPASSAPYTIQTAPGEERTLDLAGGTTIHVNGATEIRLDRRNERFARLVRGEALFEVVRDPADPFRVEAGPAVIRNLGTVFNVRHEPDLIAVDVARGSVAFQAAGQELRLGKGDAVRLSDGAIERRRRDPATIAGWRVGELSYSSATLSEVARDLSRTSGVRIRVEPSVSNRQFSGTILVEKDTEQFRRRLAALLDVDVRVAQGEWILAAPDR